MSQETEAQGMADLPTARPYSEERFLLPPTATCHWDSGSRSTEPPALGPHNSTTGTQGGVETLRTFQNWPASHLRLLTKTTEVHCDQGAEQGTFLIFAVSNIE